MSHLARVEVEEDLIGEPDEVVVAQGQWLVPERPLKNLQGRFLLLITRQPVELVEDMADVLCHRCVPFVTHSSVFRSAFASGCSGSSFRISSSVFRASSFFPNPTWASASLTFSSAARLGRSFKPRAA